MADTTVAVPPFIIQKPKISIGTTGTAVDIACAASQLAVEADQDENTAETFCGSYTSYKPPTWTVTVTVLQSFGTTGLWNQIYPLANTIQDITILPDASQPVSETNPELRAQAFVKYPNFLNASVGETSEFDLELAIQGTPTFATTPVTQEAEAEETSEETGFPESSAA